ncbi:arylamine N-acetyltransferase family protein [Streptomyces sp. 6N223]|uniref:arylamine N-acetyltransferase family protein n=1 Tax=Streptomyces sp. 6N223 TaxID=3457412 RepID=UPI003FD0CDF3
MDADAYLRRIRAARPAVADGAALAELHLRHLRAVPFENLAIHLGEEVELAESSLVDKLVRRRRGGFCYELNGAFAALLRTLGFSVELLNARVFDGETLGPPYDHMALRVAAPGESGGPWLADVGFGDHSHRPLRLDASGEQPDPAGVFRVVEAPDGDLDVLRDGTPQYRVETRPRALADFEVACWYQQTSPRSHFTRSLICSRLTETGRISLSGRKLIVTGDGRRTTAELEDGTTVLAAYRRHFGIELDAEPRLRQRP